MPPGCRPRTTRDDVDDFVRATFGPGGRDIFLAVSGATGEDLWEAPVSAGGWVHWLEVAQIRDGEGADLLESGFNISQGKGFDFTGARAGKEGQVVWRLQRDW